MLVDTEVSTLGAVERLVDRAYERSLEAEVLLDAVNALRRADLLTDAEFETKRQQIAAYL